MKCFMVLIFLASSIGSCMHAKPLFSSRNKRNALKNPKKLWPGATVVYTIEKKDFTLPEIIVMKKAMMDISSVSCVRFLERTDEKGYIRIYKGEGCFSLVGYSGQQQPMSLGRGCFRIKTVIHELFHALGFYHEHARPDRDNFITVHESNIDPKKKNNFNKMSFDDVTTLGLMYDYNSVLHYHDRSFSKDRSKTMEAKLHNNDLNEANEMSFLDILKVNLLYGCLR